MWFDKNSKRVLNERPKLKLKMLNGSSEQNNQKKKLKNHVGKRKENWWNWSGKIYK